MAPLLSAAPLSKLWSATHLAPVQSPSYCAVSPAHGEWPWISVTIRRRNQWTFGRMTWRPTMNSPAPLQTTNLSNSLPAQLQQIGLRALPPQLDDFLARAAKARWSPHQVL